MKPLAEQLGQALDERDDLAARMARVAAERDRLRATKDEGVRQEWELRRILRANDEETALMAADRVVAERDRLRKAVEGARSLAAMIDRAEAVVPRNIATALRAILDGGKPPP